jgi:GT2 family glycosyltransferase
MISDCGNSVRGAATSREVSVGDLDFEFENEDVVELLRSGCVGIPRLSLVFPAFNEADNLPTLLESAIKIGDSLGVGFEIVIVDDGSLDHSAEVLDVWSRRDPRITSVRHPQNLGYGAALRAGLRQARGELVFFSDADLQFDLREIALLLKHAEDVDIVAGYRAPRRDPWLRRVIAKLWGGLVRALFDVPVRDIDCAFKIFRREVLDAIPIESVGAFVNTEILARARAAGFQIKQVPVTHHPRQSGTQSGAHPRVILRALIELSQLYTHLHSRSQPSPKMVQAGAPASSSRGGPSSRCASSSRGGPSSRFTPSPRSTLASRHGRKLDPSH